MAKRWTQKDDELILEYYNKKGGKEKLIQLLPGHTWAAIRIHAGKLRATKENILWTEEEDNLLREFYGQKGSRQLLAEQLPVRTLNAVSHRAKMLGLTRSGWTKEEDDMVREYYGNDKEKLKNLLQNRTSNAVKSRARSLGLAQKREGWTKEEDDLVRKYYQKPGGGRKLAELLPGRSVLAIRKRASRDLNISNTRYSKWTDEEDAIIREHYPSSEEEMLKLLPRHTWEAIKMRAQKFRKSK